MPSAAIKMSSGFYARNMGSRSMNDMFGINNGLAVGPSGAFVIFYPALQAGLGKLLDPWPEI